MKFLCDHHRSLMNSCIKQAKHSWQKTLHLAQFYGSNEEWARAVLYSGNSMEIAEIILHNQPNHENAKRYVKTAAEFAFATKCNQTKCNLLALYNNVFQRLMDAPLAMDVEQEMAPLNKVLVTAGS